MIKKLGGFAKHLFKASPSYDGEVYLQFLDTQMLGRVFLGPGDSSMRGLLRRLNVPKKYQKESADYEGPITEQYLDYCRADVSNTWAIYKELRELYCRHGISRPIYRLYSEASLGKAYLDDLGVTPFLKKPSKKDKREGPGLGVDPKDIGAAMEGYYGGRSEVRIRCKPIKGIHCDIKSEYPTGNALKAMQELMIAEWVEIVHDRPEARGFLEGVTLDDLQLSETWKKLRGWARVEPNDGDILPFRTEYVVETEYGESPICQLNIGINRIVSACPAFYTFDDVIASKLLTGKLPRITRTIELVPHGRQKSLKNFRIFGNPNYEIDLTRDDLFTVIEMPLEVDAEKERVKAKQGETCQEYYMLDALQIALKILSNSTCYGILVEMIVDDHEKAVGTTVYHGGDETRVEARKRIIGEDGEDKIGDYKVERAGRFFSIAGGLVPSAGRLMLGIRRTGD